MTAIAASPLPHGLALPAALLAGLAALLAVETGVVPAIPTPAAASIAPPTVTIPAGRFDYRPGGDFIQGGVQVSSPLVSRHWQPGFEIMRYEVGEADYEACVAAAACPPAHPRHHGKGAVPGVGVSFTDAEAYAAWLSASTGQHWRLPTLEEWDRAADGLARDHGVQAAADPADPSRLWLAQFDAQSAEEGEADGALRPAGAFGANAFGVADMDGNVWEWTSTCHSRTRLDATGAAISRVDSCGVRILEGRHRMPMNVFVEDARGGGCSMGVPPDNMGFRLVRDRGWLEQATDWVRSLLA